MRGSSRRKYVEIVQDDEIDINNFLFEFIKNWRKSFTISDLCFNLNLKAGIDVLYHKKEKLSKTNFIWVTKELTQDLSTIQIEQLLLRGAYSQLNLKHSQRK